MTILVVPNLKCNVKCGYCFAHGYTWSSEDEYDLQAILKSMESEHELHKNDNFCMHGGECTLIRRSDFEIILAKMYELKKSSSLQTNCYKIDQDLIRIYKKYNTSIGVSIDGDGELNSIRGFPEDINKNKMFTEQVINNIFKLQSEGISVGVIVVLTKANASSTNKLDKLVEFILKLRNHGIKSGRLNLMWSNDNDDKYQLTTEEASYAWSYLYEKLKPYKDLQWQPFKEFVDNLLGLGHSSCSYGKCDYFSTVTRVILADGSIGNCDRTHQEGNIYTRANTSFERYEVLKQTDCEKCRYWNCCYGGCPAEGIDGDWRNKTRFCMAIYNLYSIIETEIKQMMPNIKLITEYNNKEDYFDVMHKGILNDPFEKMNWHKVYNPSSWRDVCYKPTQQQKDVPQNNQHGDFTNHGDGVKC